MMKWLRSKTISYLTKNLLKAVTIEDVLVITSKEWLVGKRKFTNEEILLLKEEAKSLSDSMLLKFMLRELKYGMTLQRYDEARTADDMIFGKAMSYSISQIELFIKKIKDL